ncbi:EAL domain-containing response regulator [Duganella callida]|uniref:EAL domain-containing response regulator n=1 Tax=Duganella callida TaxID=2561932 RepID=A0A4Y9RWS2_9BURK|nr:EAL domain-containing response regulator [Duganella callida]TFW13727.1 EAL domain-containing response regulator [Duganella callida]
MHTLSDTRAGLSPDSVAVPQPGVAALRVLLVEDDPVQRELLTAALRHCGVSQLFAAADGWTALAYLAASPCDLVISDLSLPGMDGVEFLQRAAGFDIGAVAIVSGAEAAIMSTVEHALLERGAQVLGRLSKPLSLEAVARLLAQCGAQLAPHQTPPLAPASQPTLPALRAALDDGVFQPYYQPKVDLGSGRLLGVEILARWRMPNHAVLSPAHFIPAMEDNALIDQLTYQLLDQALSDAAHWGPQPVALALNLAPHTLEDPGLPDRLLVMAQQHAIAPGRITLELTETAMARNPQLVRDCAARLRLRGFRFAVDDFGIGYSSMALLLSLPFTELKIDRSFVSSLAGSRKARTMLEAMVALGNRLDMQVVAEGIEHESELRLLRNMGCPAGQGYLFARPMAQAELLNWIAAPALPAGLASTVH